MNESELVFSELLNCNRISLYLNRGLNLDKEKSSIISLVLKKRIRGEPIQYILGKTEFMGLEFEVNPNVFIPRPETEILVETVIRFAARLTLHVLRLNILDIGTGSGNIAISLAKFLPGSIIDAIDVSEKALKVARANAELNNVSIGFIQSNLFDTYNLQPTTYNLIISNPPYIPSAEIKTLQPELRYEPPIALDGGRDGLDFYRKIISQASCYLKERGLLIMEMGFNQLDAVKNIFQNAGNFEIIEVVKDYNNIDRVIVAQRL